jgi:hypothetical protein
MLRLAKNFFTLISNDEVRKGIDTATVSLEDALKSELKHKVST